MTPARARRWGAAALAGAALHTASAAPAPGRHAAELCVATTTAAPPNCGPALADLRRDGSLSVRVDDVVYHLQLHSSQVEVVLMHGAVQIDEFTVPYEWAGSTLHFSDDERSARYEIRFSVREPAARR